MNRFGTRSPDQITQQYEIERQLADRLRHSTREERRYLYRAVYDELFRRVPDHSQLRKKANSDVWSLYGRVLRLLRRHVGPHTTFLEIGAGDCQLALEIARKARHVYAVEVSAEIVHGLAAPANFQLILSDGCNIPVPPGSVDLILSNQLIEHIHPDDVAFSLEQAYSALRPGGKFICLTPHRFSGPHDVSMYFSEVASGFHLHEYTSRELARALKGVGFRRVAQVAGAMGYYVTVPLPPVILLEALVGRLPHRWRRRFCKLPGSGILFERLILLARK